MRASRAGFLGAALGAVLGAAVVVALYESQTPNGPDEASRKSHPGAGQHSLPGDSPGERGRSSRTRKRIDRALSGLQSKLHKGLMNDNTKLKQEVAELQQKLDQVQGLKRTGDEDKTFDLTPEELKKLADRCEVRWDMPPLGLTPSMMSIPAIKKLGLTDSEAKIVNDVLADQHASMVVQLNQLYAEVSGDNTGGESLSPKSLVNEITNKSQPSDIRHAFMQISRERAGLQPTPANPSALPAVERMYRILSNAGNRSEKAIGDKIGRDRARRYREMRDHFGDRFSSGATCP